MKYLYTVMIILGVYLYTTEFPHIPIRCDPITEKDQSTDWWEQVKRERFTNDE